MATKTATRFYVAICVAKFEYQPMPANSLTGVTQLEKAIRGSKVTTAYPIAGFKGLELNVRVNATGKVADFRHRYTHPFTGKRPYMTLGQYPALSLEQAKQAYNDNQALLAQQIDPITHRETEKTKQAYALANTFEAVAKDWQQANGITNPRTLTNQEILLKPLLKAFAKTPIDTITTQQVLRLCRDIQKTHTQKGNRVKGIANQIFAHAVVNGLIEHNPVLQLQGAKALKPTKEKHHPAITDPAEFAQLLKEIDSLPAYGTTGNFNKQVLQLLALTFVRIGDLCSMQWQDINLPAKQWTFTPQKTGDNKKMVSSLVMPLPPQAVAILEYMHTITGGQDYVFYNGRRKDEPYTDPQRINDLLNKPSMNKAGIGKDYCQRGYKDVHSPHGFRASAKTMLMERLGYDELITELQMGHKMLNKYGKAYSRMEMIKQRTAMMTDWGQYLDDLKAGKIDNVIFFAPAKADSKAVNG